MLPIQKKPPKENRPTQSLVTKWGPRMVCVMLGGYYGLGLAFEWGIMARIDRFAIARIKSFFGGGLKATVWVGFLMPGVQLYSSIGVRVAAAGGAAITYDLFERIVKSIYRAYFKPSKQPATAPDDPIAT